MYDLLKTIDDPAALRALDRHQLQPLAEELRAYVLDSVSQTGGHLSSNLGTVELTIALHYVFDTPGDRIVWDVGHQTYPHKILTGRRDQMKTLRQFGGISGFPRRSESKYDTFGTAHSSTSISAALGMAIASKLQGEDRYAIAVIGDGAMTAGMAFEAMNNAGVADDVPLLVILNDNDMSISPPVGALNRHLARLMSGRFYAAARAGVERVLRVAPPMLDLARKLEEHAKGMIVPATLFEEFGFNYIGPIDGHDLDSLIPHAPEHQGIARPAVPARRDEEGPGLQAGRSRSGPVSRPRQVQSGRRHQAVDVAIEESLYAGVRRMAMRQSPSRIRGWSASRPPCARARVSSSSPSVFRNVISMSALPSSTQ